MLIPNKPTTLDITKAVHSIRKGTIARITYKTEVPVKAEYKNKFGIKIYRIVETSHRFGVKYSNIKTVKEREGSSTTKRTNNYVPVVENCIYYNTNTDKTYLQVANFNKGSNPIARYFITFDCDEIKGELIVEGSLDVLPDMLKGLVIDSYMKKDKKPNEIKRIDFDNILCIQNKNVSIGEKYFI